MRAQLAWLGLALGLSACASPAWFANRQPVARASTGEVSIRKDLLVTTALVGSRPVELILDLGATHPLSLTPDTLAAIDASPTGAVHSYRDSAGNPLTTREYRVSTLRWAGFEWRDVRAVEATWADDNAPPLRLGALGRPLFEGLQVSFDLPERNAVTLAASSGCGQSGIDVSTSSGVISTAELDEERVDVLLDSAATANIATERRFAGRRRLELGPRVVSAQLHYADLPGLPADVVLGVPFFSEQAVTIDFGARCVMIGQ